jgi:ankyrin repeat protein
MAIKRKDFQKVSSTVQEFLLKLPDEEASARLRDNLLQALHFLQLYYRLLQNRDKHTDPTQWTIDHSLSPLTPFREAPDKFDWEWTSIENPPKSLRNSLSRSTSESMRSLAPLLSLIKNGDLQQVRDEIASNEDLIFAQDALNRDCIHYAIQYEQFDILKYLLKRNPNLNNPALDGSISLHRAVYKGNAHMVKLLLDYGSPINAQDFYSRTPLHWSIIHENTECLRVLLDYNVDLNIKDQDGMSAAMWACHLDHFEHLRLINKASPQQLKFDVDNDGKSCIHWSIRKKEPLECLKALLNSETIYLVDKDGKTCLHTAAEQGALEACKIIIDYSSNKDIVNIRDSRKQTPLHVSSLNGHARLIKLLLEFGGI